MTVHSHPAAAAAPGSAQLPAFPRHVVTAVLVSHDGERWLPDVLAGLAGQERPVQNAVAADTGSTDGSARLIGETLGSGRVLHLARRTGFGAAVGEAVRGAPVLGPAELPYLVRLAGWGPAAGGGHGTPYGAPEPPPGEPVQWLWLLHDDCAPEPDALVELLRVADANPSAAVVGPKLRSWYDRRQLLEVGVSIANSGRRWTGLERREQDQGQHDQVRQVLSVSTAGMLVRRDVFERLGGFDRRLPLMRDDVDLCWRVQAAGHQVLVAPDAALRHAEAAARERRPIDCAGRSAAGPHRVDKAGAVYTLLANSPGRALPWVLVRLVLGTLLRIVAYLVGKVPGQALDEFTGLSGVLLRPGRLLAARRERGRPAVDHAGLRSLFPPPGATVRATLEQVAGNFAGRSDPELSSGGRHGAVESGPSDEGAEFLEVEQFARLKRIARRPAPVLFTALLLVSLVACRALYGGGALAGGALLPAPDGAADLWSRYLESWQPVGTGSTGATPPYLALLAGLSTLLLGSTGLALTLLLVFSVPLAGLSAYLASRPLVDSRLLRAWGSAAYALLPAVTGALAGGRLGTAVLAVLLPPAARAAVAAAGLRSPETKPAWRPAWACALLLTAVTAFTPVVWPIAAVLAAAALVPRAVRRAHAAAYAVRALVLLATPLVLLAPWSLDLLVDPSGFLREAGLPYGGGTPSALGLLVLDPGGPATAGGVLAFGLVLAALAALLRAERRTAVLAAWTAALTALVLAAVANGSGWAGPAVLVYGLALLAAAAVGAEGARERVAAQSFGWRQPAAALVAATAAAAPLVAAAVWAVGGADGPLARRGEAQVPAFVAAESATGDRPRTLVLDGEGADGTADGVARVSYTLVRGAGAHVGDGDVARRTGGDERLGRVVARLVAGSGADQTRQLGAYAVRYVIVREGAPRQMSRVLDATPGLTRLSEQESGALWRVDAEFGRITIVPGGGRRDGGGGEEGRSPVVPAGPVEAHTQVPPGAEGRVLRIADAADPGWRASLDGEPLEPVTVDGWAQGFELPAEGGRLDLTYETPLSRTAWVWAQGFLALVVLVLALPGRRRAVDDDLPEAVPAVPADPVPGEGRRARRLRAAQEAREAAGAAAPGPQPEPEPTSGGRPGEPYVPPQQDGGYGAGYEGAGYGDGGYGAGYEGAGYGDGGYGAGYGDGGYGAGYEGAGYGDGGYGAGYEGAGYGYDPDRHARFGPPHNDPGPPYPPYGGQYSPGDDRGPHDGTTYGNAQGESQ